MQTTGCFHDHIIKTSTDVAKDITHAVVDLDPTDAMLNAYALAGNDRIVVGLLLHCQFTAFGLLLGLKGLDLTRFVALKTGVFTELAAGWKAQALFIGQLRIVLLACPGRTENLDLTRAFVTDAVILDRVPFLLATVVPLLLIGILRTPDRAFAPINDELQTRTGGQNLADVLGLAHRQLALVSQRLIQDGGQAMNPLIGLRLSQSEEVTLHHLHRIEFEIEQDEHQLVFPAAQRPTASAPAAPLPGLFPLLVAPIQRAFIRLDKSWQQRRE